MVAIETAPTTEEDPRYEIVIRYIDFRSYRVRDCNTCDERSGSRRCRVPVVRFDRDTGRRRPFLYVRDDRPMPRLRLGLRVLPAQSARVGTRRNAEARNEALRSQRAQRWRRANATLRPAVSA